MSCPNQRHTKQRLHSKQKTYSAFSSQERVDTREEMTTKQEKGEKSRKRKERARYCLYLLLRGGTSLKSEAANLRKSPTAAIVDERSKLL
jgi:hypothetical protein